METNFVATYPSCGSETELYRDTQSLSKLHARS